MIIKILNNNSSTPELCLLEFQGELVGELAGNELGEIVIKKASLFELFFQKKNNKFSY